MKLEESNEICVKVVKTRPMDFIFQRSCRVASGGDCLCNSGYSTLPRRKLMIKITNTSAVIFTYK